LALHILSDTPGGSQWLNYILLMFFLLSSSSSILQKQIRATETTQGGDSGSETSQSMGAASNVVLGVLP